MRVRVFDTLGPDVGEHYSCCVCGTEEELGSTEAVLCEMRSGTLPTASPGSPFESDNLRDAHYVAQFDGRIITHEYGLVCSCCLQERSGSAQQTA